MALFKIAKGSLSNMSSQACREGYCYVAQDTDNHVYFLVDLQSAEDSSGRATLSAEYAQTYPVTIVEWGASS